MQQVSTNAVSDVLLVAMTTLRASVQSAVPVLGMQIWAADDLGFHPRLVLGREAGSEDRAIARACCISGQRYRRQDVLAVPLQRAGKFPAACLFLLGDDADEAVEMACEARVVAMTAELDDALQNERMARLSGSARQSDQLRHSLAIAHAVEDSVDLQVVFAELHESLRSLMYAENFYIVVLDEAREWLHFIYHHDPADHFWDALPFHEGGLQGSLSAYVVGAGRIVRGSAVELLTQAGHSDTVEEDVFGPHSCDWLGVPMMVGDESIGAVVVQSYDPAVRFADSDPSTLSMVAEALAAALHRRRVRESLQRTVAERTAELQAAKNDAERALDDLRTAQQQLVQAEKMASLGHLVAGVAHEINTPLGVALTASSALHERANALALRMQDGGLTRSQLQEFIAIALESATLIERNLGRAAQLVQSFKQVSVDRTTDGRRRFRLDTYLGDLLASLAPAWDARPVKVDLACAAGVEMDSFPGALGQIVTNLVQNALMHAFAPDQAGTIRISAGLDAEGSVWIDVRDDGLGVVPHLLTQIFEPFFTTKRNRGGTGLGLHIVFNLVTQKLGGQVTVESRPGAGCCFRLTLPSSAPE